MDNDLSTASLEDLLGMWAWGAWVRSKDPEDRSRMGYGVQPWAVKIKPNYPDPPRVSYDVDPEYMEALDRLMCQVLTEHQKHLLRAIYVNRSTLRPLSRKMHTSVTTLRQARDTCLHMLYGALMAESA